MGGDQMTETGTILFLCPHSAAKSVLAAAYFDRLAQERGLSPRAAFAGTEPDDELSPRVVAALGEEGIDVSGQRPRRIEQADLVGAHRVISLGRDLGELMLPGFVMERWDDVPPASQDLEATRAAIRGRVAALADELEQAGDSGRDAANERATCSG
jgi:arsenate reductase (thioredoxin)